MFPHLFIMFLPGPPLMSRTVLVPTTHRLLRKQLENLLVSNAIREIKRWKLKLLESSKGEMGVCELRGMGDKSMLRCTVTSFKFTNHG